MPKGVPNRRYTAEFKTKVIETMRTEGLSYSEAGRRFGIEAHTLLQIWERIYLAEGPEGFAIERRGHSTSARPLKRVTPDREKELLAEVQRLRAENTYLKKLQALVLEDERRRPNKRGRSQELRRELSLKVLLSVARLPRSTFYYEVKRMGRPDKYTAVKTEIQKIFTEHRGRYGYRRITAELHARGFCCNHKVISRLMKELELVCRVRAKRYRSYKGEIGRIAPNLLERNFEAERPNEKMVTDITEFHLFGQKLYLSLLLDLHSRDIVSYTISDRPVLEMVTSMLEKAFRVIPDGTGLILHSDQGWHYQHKRYRQMLEEKGIRQSMSRKGNCLDNAVIENFFGILKSELLYLQDFDSTEYFKTELIAYLDYYNNRRGKLKLNGLPPAIHRRQALSIA